jgi:8-oxo-dGTP pyrophosphatase MutT (NUDIX family)
MNFPCIQAARSFRRERHLPFTIADERVGWIGRADLPLLQPWQGIFRVDDAGVELHPALDTVEVRSSVLDTISRALAASGRITGWRNERYAIRSAFEAPPLALIERAAARFFGTLTFGVHANGIAAGDTPRLWLARRSLSKAVDPGLFDNVVGGGIGWGYGIVETLVKECWEESGIPAELAIQATPGRSFMLLAEIPEGVQAERIYAYDLMLPAAFQPANQDGEVSEHRLLGIDAALELIARGEVTVDASLVTLDWLLRSGAIDATAPGLEGFEALLGPGGPPR